MKVEQLVVSLTDLPDKLSIIANLMAENCINICALSLVDASGPDNLRMIVNDTGKAFQIIRDNGFSVKTTEVLVIEVPDKPGGLATVLRTIKEKGLTLKYLYAFSQKSGESGLLIFRMDHEEQAVEALTKKGIRVLSSEELYAL